MNHLAHLLLSEPTPEARLGNLAADYISQREYLTLPPPIQRGVMHHRQVDSLTDRHPVVFRGMARLPERWGWFKGILLDVYYDHLLATNWDMFCAIPLPLFAFEVNADLLSIAGHLPDSAAASVQRIAGTNRLLTYLDLAGVEAALFRITGILRERIPDRAVDLVEALTDLTAVHADLTADFAEFFPQLAQFSAEWCRAA